MGWDEAQSVRERYLIKQVEREIAAVVGVEHVNTDPALLHEQSSDWSWIAQHLNHRKMAVPTADLFVEPANAQEVADVLRIASE